MTIYIRRTGEIPDGSVTESKLADLAISTSKLQAQAVTLAKAHAAINMHHFTGDETEVSVVGVSESEEKTMKIVRSSSNTKGIQASTLHINAEMKTSAAAHAASMKVYIDAEGEARITINTTSESYEMVEGEADISDLSTGTHVLHIKLYSADAGETAYNDLLEVFLEK